jgi:hypothetical protein
MEGLKLGHFRQTFSPPAARAGGTEQRIEFFFDFSTKPVITNPWEMESGLALLHQIFVARPEHRYSAELNFVAMQDLTSTFL